MDDLVTFGMSMFGVLLARPEDCLEHTNVLRSIGITRDQFSALKCRNATPNPHEFVLDDAFTHANFVFFDSHTIPPAPLRSPTFGKLAASASSSTARVTSL
jgi:hypothetical protein